MNASRDYIEERQQEARQLYAAARFHTNESRRTIYPQVREWETYDALTYQIKAAVISRGTRRLQGIEP